jgi:hypothetical protein
MIILLDKVALEDAKLYEEEIHARICDCERMME